MQGKIPLDRWVLLFGGEHAVAFVDMKWPRASAKHRKSIAEALANVTSALLSARRGAPADADIRRALYSWSFNKTRREAGPPPDDLAATVRWLSTNTVKLNAGVPATQVAEWAGHSVHVLLKVYAKCIEGQDEAARQRIDEMLKMHD